MGYIFIVSTAYFDSPDHHWFYLETQYLPLAVFLAVPFAVENDPSVFKAKKWTHFDK
ncbi:MAG: hypothetical protein U5L45_21100 [Saprospiraceae bacterium]|nr:hypothetical protein [Saprospiraceae bacterium]